MPQRAIPFMQFRGGSSKGLFFSAHDLPTDPAGRDRLVLGAMEGVGPGDPRQIDGLGGATSLTSKVAVVSLSGNPDVDLDYLFLQVVVGAGRVSAGQNCGNMLAAVLPFAIESGLFPATDPTTSARIYMVNTGGICEVTVQTPNGQVEYGGDPRQGDPRQGDPRQGDPRQGDPRQGDPRQGDPRQGDPRQGDPRQGDPRQGDPRQGDPRQGDPRQGDPRQGGPRQGNAKVDGVPGTAAPILCNYLDIAGSSCGALLPTGNVQDVVEGTAVTCIDNGMPEVVLRAADFGLTGYETPAELAANDTLRERLERIRLAAGPLMNLGDVTNKTVPKMCLIAPPRQGGMVSTRTFIPHTVHEAIGVLGAVSTATVCLLPGSVAEGVAVLPERAVEGYSVEHPTGEFTVQLELTIQQGNVQVGKSGVIRTARLLSRGDVLIPMVNN